jgi:hypothetical protein
MQGASGCPSVGTQTYGCLALNLQKLTANHREKNGRAEVYAILIRWYLMP